MRLSPINKRKRMVMNPPPQAVIKKIRFAVEQESDGDDDLDIVHE